ncbi:MAG: hypothetical protein WCJ30_15590, partial [Deltaproteobacteria bacterium]
MSMRGTSLIDARITSIGTSTGGQFSVLVPAVPDATDRLIVALVGVDATGHIAYAVASPAFTTSGRYEPSTAITAPSIVSWAWATNTLVSPASLNIRLVDYSGHARRFDYMRYVYSYAQSHFGMSGVPLIAWSQYGVNWACGNCLAPVPTTRFGIPFRAQLFFAADTASQPFWADAVTAHELGHWVMLSLSGWPGEGG